MPPPNSRTRESGAMSSGPRTATSGANPPPGADRRQGPGRPPRTDAERAAHRAHLLEAAMTTIRLHGGDVSVDEMAAEAGVSKPVYYSEFGGKAGIADALAVALAERVEHQLIARLTRAEEMNAEIGLRLAIEALVDLVEEEPEVYGFLVRCMRDNDQGLLDNALVRTLHSRVVWLTPRLAPAGDAALLAVLAHGVFGFVFASVESWRVRRRPARAKLVDALVAVVMHGFNMVGRAPQKS